MTEQKTPSQKMKKSVFDGVEVQDSLGRKIRFRDSDILDQWDLNRAIGKDENEDNRSMALMSLKFSMIDGFLLPNPPNNYAELRGNIKRIGNEGFNALIDFLNENVEKSDENQQAEEIKKS